MRALLLGCMALPLGACLRSSFSAPDSRLDRAIFYREQSEDAHRSISGEPTTVAAPEQRPAGPAERVPDPALVDTESKIQLYVDKEQIGLDGGTADVDARLAQIHTEREMLAAVLAEVEQVAQSRLRAIAAARVGGKTAGEQVVAFIDAEGELARRILELPLPAAQVDEIEDAMGAARNRYDGLRNWFDRRVRTLEEHYDGLERQLGRETVSLRLQAWLVHGEQESPIHLEHYDGLEEGRLEYRDRLGLDLSPARKERLTSEFAASAAFARRANAVLDGERKVLEALRDTLAASYVEAVEKIARIVEDHAPDQLDQRRRDVAEKGRAFWSQVSGAAAALVADARAQTGLRALRAEFEQWLRDRDSNLTRVVVLAAQARALAQDWRSVAPERLPELVQRTSSLVAALRGLDLGALSSSAQQVVREFLEQKGRDAGDAARSAVVDALGSAPGKDFLQAIHDNYEAIARDVATVRRVLDQAGTGIQAVLDAANGIRSSNVPLATVPESFDVPYDEIRDTSIDLRRTGREVGDHVVVRATRYRDQKVIDTSRAEFRLTQFGHSARLSPAVVLVTPDQLAGDGDDFRFAPTLSWLHSWQPREDERLSDFMWAFRPALGIHASFLNFDNGSGNQEAVQIGLGGTLSLWDGRLQFGAGYNLMAGGADEGRIYYFIGSDLIGILQTAGIVAQ